MLQVFISNDNTITLTGLQNAVSGAYLNAATVSAQVKTSAGVNVGTAITLAYVAASDGNYRGTLEEDAALVEGTAYVLHISADAGSDLIGNWQIPMAAVIRRS